MVSQKRWNKTKECDEWIALEVCNKSGLEHSALKKKRGFLIYVGLTYPSLVPYFKGIHLTLDCWREKRDAGGWRIRNYCVTR